MIERQLACCEVAPGNWSMLLPVCVRPHGHADDWHASQRLADGHRLAWRSLGPHGVHWSRWVRTDEPVCDPDWRPEGEVDIS